MQDLLHLLFPDMPGHLHVILCGTICRVGGYALVGTITVLQLYLQDGEIQQLLAARAQEAGAEGQLHERLNFVAFKYQLLVDMVSAATQPPDRSAAHAKCALEVAPLPTRPAHWRQPLRDRGLSACPRV